jgi:hypothetical protein
MSNNKVKINYRYKIFQDFTQIDENIHSIKSNKIWKKKQEG